MRNLLLSLLLIPVFAMAQPTVVQKPVICAPAEHILSELTTSYQEQIIWIGIKDGSKFAMLVNPSTYSWSIVQLDDDKTACLIDSGQGFKFRPGLFVNPKDNI